MAAVPIQQGQGCFSSDLDSPKRICFYTTFTAHSTSANTSAKISTNFISTKQGKATFDRARKLTTPDIDSFRERNTQ